MKINEHTTDTATVTLASGIDVELELPQKPDCIMMYKDSLQHQVGDKLLVGYLVQDTDCPNPLEDDYGMGLIYEARRHGRTLGDFMKAKGLDSEGNPDLDLIDDEDVEEECKRQLRLMAQCKWDGPNIALKIDGDLDGEGIEREEDELMIDYVLRGIDEGEIDLEDYFDFDTIKTELWQKGRLDGTIGEKYAVSLDVYEHGGVSYSLSGHGMQCQFDTARGGAVWVPTESCVEEIERRGPVYQKGAIVLSTLRSKQQYNIRTYKEFGKYDDIVYPPFEDWGAAFKYLESLEGLTYVQPLLDGQHDAARELAKFAAEQYTDWCNGNCFGYVIATYILDADLEEGAEIECEESQSSYGYVGDDYAYNSLEEEFDRWKQSL